MNELLPDFPLSVFGIWVNGAMWQTALCHASGKTPLPAAAVTPPNFLPTRNRIDLQAKKGTGRGRKDGRAEGECRKNKEIRRHKVRNRRFLEGKHGLD